MENQKIAKKKQNFVIIQLFGKARLLTVCIDTACFIDSINTKFSLQGGELQKSVVDRNLQKQKNKLGLSWIEKDYEHMSNNTKDWQYLVPKVNLNPGYPSIRKKFFKVNMKKGTVVTHLRLNIYPDGGIARIRTYGKIQPKLTPHNDYELTSNLYNSYCILFNDNYIGHPNNIIQPNKMADRSDGWFTIDRTAKMTFNTKMSFDKISGTKWAIFKLGRTGYITRIIIDTRGFMGNAPHMVRVESSYQNSYFSYVDFKNVEWQIILPQIYINPGTEQIIFVEKEFYANYIKITISPDGGISRFRVFGIH